MVATFHGKEQYTEKPACQFDISIPNLMEIICEKDNLNLAYKKVCRNKGIPGIDNISVNDLKSWIKKNKSDLINSLLDGTYKPRPVKGIYIPKPRMKGVRCIGVLSVVDRLVQNAIFQVICDPIDNLFCDHSFGFRKNRRALDAIQQAKIYILDGNKFVADIDVEKFFDNIHHDKIMYKLSRIIHDKRILRIIRRFLQVGMWRYDVYIERVNGVYQGGSLSPLLSNLMLHEFDMILEQRGHKFCRYADDIKIYTKSYKAAVRVLNSVEKYLDRNLKLKCNERKTKACKVNDSEFLGYKIDEHGQTTALQENVESLKYKIKKLTNRSIFRNLKIIIAELNQVIVGWTSYFRYDYRQDIYRDLDTMLRRRIRANIMRRAIVLRSNGLGWIRSIGCQNCNIDFNKIRWNCGLVIRKANYIIRNEWFEENGLRSILKSKERYLNNAELKNFKILEF
ncbi:MAG: group II intron reverse transcriptase/maturase [Holosporales bacterium]|jgi:RNA-directed DNA polymerase|nr:group II intron reverse transcriptase/maturase [Holosporales bacterium]